MNNNELVSALMGFLPIGIFLLILYVFFRWQIKKQKGTVETHLTILNERNELARQAVKLQEEQNELLRKLLERLG
jgi:ATP-dependent Zn protease